jgi:uncharacterized iron-regulated protein
VGVGLLALLLPLSALVASCSSLPSRDGAQPLPEAPAAPDLPRLEAVTRVLDARKGRASSLEELLDQVASADVVFLGETHLDETTHRVELAVYEGLVRRRKNVTLAMEMFERDVQGALDDYVSGRTNETEFLRTSRPWSNYRTGYRPMIEAAKRHGLRVVASNVPASLRKNVAFRGQEAWDELTSEQRELVAAELHPHPEEYWDRFRRAVRGHMGAIFAGRTPEQMIHSSQSLWDNTMAESCLRALDASPGGLVLHVNGEFHSAHGQGTLHQLLLRRPGLRVAAISVLPASDLSSVDLDETTDRADWIVYAEARAREASDGFWAVTLPRELRYRLRVPKTASEGARLPLVIALPEEPLRSRDLMTTLELLLGDEAAIAVVEPPILETGKDMRTGGRWFQSETFTSDLSDLDSGIERIVSSIVAAHPVRRDRVVLVGVGTGATVVATTAIYGQGIEGRALAIFPREAAGLAEMALPSRDEEGRTLDLLVLASPDEEAFWSSQLDDFRRVGVKGMVEALDPEHGLPLDRLLTELGTPVEARTENPIVIVESPSRTARQWALNFALARCGRGARPRIVTPAELAAVLESHSGSAVRVLAFAGEPFLLDPDLEGVVTSGDAISFVDLAWGDVLPVPTGAFGGTTVVVAPEGLSEDEKGALRLLVEHQPQRARSPFSRVEVVIEGEGESLESVLQKMADEGASREVLLVPAAFCATAERMQALAASADPWAAKLRLSFSPGLGEKAHALLGDASLEDTSSSTSP